MWNDTDIPLAYLITFRSYGTWLHGDERGSVNRCRNQYKSARLPHEKKWLKTNSQRLKSDPVILDASQRQCVDAATRETCDIRGWHLYAINVRTNHAHTVVSIGDKKPEVALNAFKANATEKCVRRAAGKVPGVHGLIREASVICGTNEALSALLIMSSMVRVTTYLILTTEG
jgi:hypothetical protein